MTDAINTIMSLLLIIEGYSIVAFLRGVYYERKNKLLHDKKN